MKFDIIIAGVGGQGTVLASRLLAASAINEGYYVRTSETIGMAQRGGSVVSHVRIGSEKTGPIIPFGSADLIIGYEPFEVIRNIRRLSPTGTCIVNTKAVMPFAGYEEDDVPELREALKFIKSISCNSIFINGSEAVEKLGYPKMLNSYLIGAASSFGLLPFSNNAIKESMLQIIPQKYVNKNIEILNIGFNYSVPGEKAE